MTGRAQHLSRLQDALGYRFSDESLLEKALTHRSTVAPRQSRRSVRADGTSLPAASNERLEFIGDRVLGLVMAEWLYEQFPHEPEGALGPRHASLVSRNALAPIAEAAGVAAAVVIAEHEERAGVRHLANVLADALEAILGALYLDGGLNPVRSFVRDKWSSLLAEQTIPPKDPKTALQEFLLARGSELPNYRVIHLEGPSHAPRFTVSVSGLGSSGEGTAGSKRLAESEAATMLLKNLEHLKKSSKTPK